MKVDWSVLEKRWLKAWDEHHLFEADPTPDTRKPRFFITVAYPYPNSPQHIGHGRTYTVTDVYARYMRMKGYTVLFPMGFHYTGTPILAMSKRLTTGDEELHSAFLNIYKVPPKTMTSFDEPLNIARYFHDEIKHGMKEMGYSIDWRREFTTIDPSYSRFIEWQFNRLKEKKLITQGSHPVGWCPTCKNPVGQHDTLEDKEPEIDEFTLIKFRLDGKILPTATLRAETVFGVTNIWIHPDAEYVEAHIEGETWIVSERGAEKLQYLGREVSITKRFPGKQLIGQSVENPMTGLHVPILPASFVDPGNASGVVMSVPAHAPFDYQALLDFRLKKEDLQRYQLDPSLLDQVQPISIIEVEGFSEIPARDVVEKMKIHHQDDPKLEAATEDVYGKEFHLGVMKESTGSFSGMPVTQAKEAVKEVLIRKGSGDVMYEILNRPVYCRCGSECLVKIFENQWFIDYADASWKEQAQSCLDEMKVVPEDVRLEFTHTINWLKGKACARREGLGTRLPWDTDWIIESLSDSVIYMAYYTIAPHLKDIPVEQLSPEVFNYIFLGEGDPSTLSTQTGISQTLLERMREEFTYFYPLDSRQSGRDLIPNHLTFFIFNHVALFPREYWPKRIVVNGSVLMEGKKMSKSYGNIIPLREAVREFGVDPLRLSLVATAGLLQDVDFSPSLAKSMRERLERFYTWTHTILNGDNTSLGQAVEWRLAEKWLWSRVNRVVKDATTAMDELRFRDAVQQILYTLDQDIQKYTRLTVSKGEQGQLDQTLLTNVVDLRVKLFAPFTPFICEELWKLRNGEGFISQTVWPHYDAKALDEGVEEAIRFLDQLVDDVKDVTKILKGEPVKVRLYAASPLKVDAYQQLLNGASMGEVMTHVKGKEMNGSAVGSIAKSVKRWSVDVGRMPKSMQRQRNTFLTSYDEITILKDAAAYLEQEIQLPVEIYGEDDPKKVDPEGRAGRAEPLKPAIHVEKT